MGCKAIVSHSSSSFEARRRGSHLRMTLLPLPPQLPHQCARRMAEQLLHRRGIELVDALKILGVDAAGYEQAIDPEAVGARQIGAHGIPDGENAADLNRMPMAPRGRLHAALLHRP